MKLINDEELNLVLSDMAEMIDVLQKFDFEKFSESLNSSILSAILSNSTYVELEKEEINLRRNLKELKNIRRNFAECMQKQFFSFYIYIFLSFFSGGGAMYALIIFHILKF